MRKSAVESNDAAGLGAAKLAVDNWFKSIRDSISTGLPGSSVFRSGLAQVQTTNFPPRHSAEESSTVLSFSADWAIQARTLPMSFLVRHFRRTGLLLAALFCVTSWMLAANEGPVLYFGRQDLPGLRARATGDDAALWRDSLQRIRKPGSEPDSVAQAAVAEAIIGLVLNDAKATDNSIALYENSLQLLETRISTGSSSSPLSAIQWGSALGSLATVQDLLSSSRPADELRKSGVRLLALASAVSALYSTASKNELIPVSAALPQAGAGLCALSLRRDPQLGPRSAPLYRASRSMITRVLDGLGSKDWPPDGIEALRVALGNDVQGYRRAYIAALVAL